MSLIREKFEVRISKDELVELTNANAENFKEVVAIALSEEQPMAWRASWILNKSIKKNDSRMKEYVSDLINFLADREDGHLRELLKIIEKMEVSEEKEGRLFDICISVWEVIGKSPSVRITAFKILVKIAKKYPELTGELEFLTHNDYVVTLSAGIRNSFEKMKRELLGKKK